MRINTYVGRVGIRINTSRMDRNLKEAQKALNLAVRTDTEPFVPHLNGRLRRAWFPDGVYGGVLEYNTVYAHYLYEGEIYGPNIPIKDSGGNITGWYSPPKKEPTGRKLTYHEPGTTDHWFEHSKEKNLSKWVKIVKEKVGEA